MKQAEYFIADIDALTPYANNPRTHSKKQIDQIAASIREFGFLAPLVISGDNTILCGFGRYQAAKKLGLTKIPCVREEHLTEAQRRAYIIADNQLTINAGWDEELLKVEIESLKESAFNVSLTGFSEQELGEIFGGEAEERFNVPAALAKATFAKKGDLWLLGSHRLYCGDALNLEDMALLMDGRKANLVLTDPPYNVDYEGMAGDLQNDKMAVNEFYGFLLTAFQNMAAHTEPGGAAYVFHADTQGLNFSRAFTDAGFKLAGVCVWAKHHFAISHGDYHWKHEPVLYGYHPGAPRAWYATEPQSSVWYWDKPVRNGDHPTEKPVGLLKTPIENSSAENGIILDPFAGSGSTLIAAERAKRICYLMELDEKYASVILRRYAEETGRPEEIEVLREGKKIPYRALVREVGQE